MPLKKTQILLLISFVALCPLLPAQHTVTDTLPSNQDAKKEDIKFWSLQPSPTFNKKRFWISAGTGAAIYTGASITLWNAWYKDFPLSSFHTFNDMKEWEGMDKAGHLQATHLECNYAFQGALWTGMERRKAMWTAVGVGMGIQTTIEIMDGFSEEWGFSIGDMAFNVLGAGLFVAQEMAWKEQRILMKVSSNRPDYSTSPIYSVDGGHQTTLEERADDLYGTSPTQVLFKDYNAMTIWASFNLHDFSKNRNSNKIPKWLNLAVGYGAGNIYGGFENSWTTDEGVIYVLDNEKYPRYKQFYLSPDIDLTKIPSRHRWLKLILGVVNWIKIPAPALEINTQGKVKFHAVHW